MDPGVAAIAAVIVEVWKLALSETEPVTITELLKLNVNAASGGTPSACGARTPSVCRAIANVCGSPDGTPPTATVSARVVPAANVAVAGIAILTD